MDPLGSTAGSSIEDSGIAEATHAATTPGGSPHPDAGW
jgi:hypothetical protein